MVKLKNLQLEFNKQIEVINKYIWPDVKSLENLNLLDNEISYIQNDAFEHFGKLKTLILSNNKISHIEKGAFRNMNSLTKLNLHGLKIPKGSSLKGLFKDLHSLQTLTLTGSNTAKGNFLAPIHPGSLRNLKQLKFLILQQSTLTLLHEKVFSHLANLEEMYLQLN